MSIHNSLFFNYMLAVSVLFFSACRNGADPEAVEWPRIQSPIKQSPAMEKKISEMLGKLTLEQKIGQMVQIGIHDFSAEKMKQYHFGSVLNGGGGWPGKNKHAAVSDWVALADSIWLAAMDSSAVGIPLLWGTDAVHGHNNVIGATIFPHNIGLGAADDPAMMKKIGEATAKEVAVTGIDWNFAPTLAVVRDDRWGRSYEGYSESPDIVARYAPEMVEGLQGNLGESHVIATAKHFIGDGGTKNGDDRGDNMASEKELRDIHGSGYFSALNAGVQTVMASFSSWRGKNMHAHKYLLTDVLKGRMGFDGFVISDWDGIQEVAGCTKSDCPQAVNAGIDMFMIPFEGNWKPFIKNLRAHVESGRVPMSRIDDAVRRILRVKFRSGLFDKPMPSKRALAGKKEILGAESHRALARDAARKSLVLLKNKNSLLPISRKARILVAGRGADNPAMQAGGWTITWQGTGNAPEDYKGFTTILQGIRQVAESVEFDVTGGKADSSRHDVAIVVIGETPYAESKGDIEGWLTLEHTAAVPEDRAVLDTIRKAGVPIVTVFLSGRPMYVNRELNRSHAFVAAWLPGSEGAGIADVLFRAEDGKPQFDFTGRLSFSWPAAPCHTPVNRGDAEYAPLFAYGYGLSYRDTDTLSSNLPEAVHTDYGCTGLSYEEIKTDTTLPIYTGTGRDPGEPWMGDPSNWDGIPGQAGAKLPNISVTAVDDRSGIQGAALRLNFKGDAYWIWSRHLGDATPFYISGHGLVFDIMANSPVSGKVEVRVMCGYPCMGSVDFTKRLKSLPLKNWQEVRLPLSQFHTANFRQIDGPILLSVTGKADITIGNIRWEKLAQVQP